MRAFEVKIKSLHRFVSRQETLDFLDRAVVAVTIVVETPLPDSCCCCCCFSGSSSLAASGRWTLKGKKMHAINWAGGITEEETSLAVHYLLVLFF